MYDSTSLVIAIVLGAIIGGTLGVKFRYLVSRKGKGFRSKCKKPDLSTTVESVLSLKSSEELEHTQTLLDRETKALTALQARHDKASEMLRVYYSAAYDPGAFLPGRVSAAERYALYVMELIHCHMRVGEGSVQIGTQINKEGNISPILSISVENHFSLGLPYRGYKVYAFTSTSVCPTTELLFNHYPSMSRVSNPVNFPVIDIRYLGYSNEESAVDLDPSMFSGKLKELGIQMEAIHDIPPVELQVGSLITTPVKDFDTFLLKQAALKLTLTPSREKSDKTQEGEDV